MKAALEFVGAVCLFAICAGLIGYVAALVKYTVERRALCKRVYAWRRDRPRAQLKGMLLVADQAGRPCVVPVFAPGSAALVADVDPLTGELVQHGWSESELREVSRRPSEFFVE